MINDKKCILALRLALPISGILERPSLPTSIEEVTYKIFMIGRSGVGKTSVVGKLAGTLESNNYTETNGIRKTNVFWPVKIWDKVVLFKLQFWDTSENSIKKYSHILSVCNKAITFKIIIYTYLIKKSNMMWKNFFFLRHAKTKLTQCALCFPLMMHRASMTFHI